MSACSKIAAITPTGFHALRREYRHSATYMFIGPEQTGTVHNTNSKQVLKPDRSTVKREIMTLVRRLNVFSETAEVKKEWRYNSTTRIRLQAGAALPFIPCTTKGAQ